MFNKTVFKNELFLTRRTFIISFVILAGCAAMFGGFSSSIVGNDQLMNAFSSYPQSILDAFNMDIMMLSTFEGWIAGEPYIMFILILGSIAAVMASTSIAKEVDQKTGESMFTLPISRRSIFLSKVISNLIYITGMFAVFAVVTFAAGYMTVGVDRPMPVLQMMLAAYLICLAFTGAGYVVTVLTDSERSAMSIGIGIVLISFVFNIMAGLSESLKWAGDLSIFNLFDTKALTAGSSLSLLAIAVALAIYFGGVAIGSEVFVRKNITT